MFEELKNDSIRFYPIKKSMMIEGRNKEKKDLPSLFSKLERLEKKVNTQMEEMEEARELAAEENKKLYGLIEKMMGKIDAMHGEMEHRR